MENNLFKAAFAAHLFPTRPAYSDPNWTVGASAGPRGGAGPQSGGGPSDQLYVKTDVGVLDVGPAQLVYLPGEVFPFTTIRGHVDEQQMPVPPDCYDPNSKSFHCGTAFPMTPWISARMTRPYHFFAGLGEDMIGYLFPIGNFVGDQGEVAQNPWAAYQADTGASATDRFGRHHSDDSESLGPHAGEAVTDAALSLLGTGWLPAHRIRPGLYVDDQGHLSDSPFSGPGFDGAVGVKVVGKRGGTRVYRIGQNATGWVTFDSRPDPGTAGTALSYSVNTAGIIRSDGTVILIDVFAGAQKLLPPPSS